MLIKNRNHLFLRLHIFFLHYSYTIIQKYMNLTNKDYQKIVKYYNIRKPANKTHKQVGEEILANK